MALLSALANRNVMGDVRSALRRLRRPPLALTLAHLLNGFRRVPPAARERSYPSPMFRQRLGCLHLGYVRFGQLAAPQRLRVLGLPFRSPIAVKRVAHWVAGATKGYQVLRSIVLAVMVDVVNDETTIRSTARAPLAVPFQYHYPHAAKSLLVVIRRSLGLVFVRTLTLGHSYAQLLSVLFSIVLLPNAIQLRTMLSFRRRRLTSLFDIIGSPARATESAIARGIDGCLAAPAQLVHVHSVHHVSGSAQ